MRIRFEDIDRRLEDIWTHLIGAEFNKERAKLLMGFNVKIKDSRKITKASMDLWNLNP